MAGGAELLLVNAAIGGATSAVAGGDPLKGALLGAVGGGIASGISGGIGNLLPGAAGAPTGVTAAPTLATTPAAAAVPLPTPTISNFLPDAAGAATTATPAVATGAPGSAAYMAAEGATIGLPPSAPITPPAEYGALRAGERAFIPPAPTAQEAFRASELAQNQATSAAADKGMFGGLKDWWGSLSGKEKLLYGGGAGIGALMLSERMGAGEPPSGEYKGPLRKYKFDPFGYSRSVYAEGGITSLANGGYDRTVGEMPQYQAMASGGISDLGSYSDGGRMLRGPGDGMSDNIPGVIGGRRPARLADGEFVVPADVVSHLGNGSTDAGAKQLYAMMDRVRKQRTGTKKQGRQINPMRAMPA